MRQKNILIVEDDFLNRRLVKKALSENGYNVLEAKNANETLNVLENNQVDFIILDINLGKDEVNGISIGRTITDKYSIPFIYLTAYENTEIISEAIMTQPYSYLTKPFKNVDLITTIELAARKSSLTDNDKKITVKDGDYNVQIVISDINYIESKGNYLLFHTDDKTYTSRCTIKNIIEVLPESDFARVHRAYIVNKRKIERFTSKTILIKNCQIPVSKGLPHHLINSI